ncbi:MAG: tetratricopeptide repeat protein [Planctomycetes bacterium]|nr:tetratricopeptide repeat protein [Planctomycetota bacterium]
MRYAILLFPALLLAACASSRLPAKRGSERPMAGPEYNENVPEATPRETVVLVADGLLKEGDSLFGQNKYDEARRKYEKAAEAAGNENNEQVLVEALAQVARMYSVEGKFDEGRPWLARAEEHADSEEPLGWSRFLGVQGRYFWRDEKDNDKAKTTFIKMYEYCKEKKLFSRQLDAAHMVAIVAPPDEQVEWALNSIDAAEKAGEKGWLAVLWNNLGWTYEEQGEYPKMLEALQNARKYHYEVGNDLSKLVADFGVGRAWWRNKDFKQARNWIEQSFEQAQQYHADQPDNTEFTEWVGWGNIYLADLLVDENQPEEALKRYKAGRPLIVEAGIEDWWPEGLKEVDDKIAKLESADD